MSAITFDCDVTEFQVNPNENNDENSFSIEEKCLIIRLMDTKTDKSLMTTEIEKKDAIQLSKLILLSYGL